MICSLNCFCDFLEATTPERRAAVVKRYKKDRTGAAKGMMVYYNPALRVMRGTLCPDGALSEKLSALRTACTVPAWTDKLNQARIESNVRVFNAFRSEFGNKKLEVLSSPRMQYLPSNKVAINIQPELYAEVDGELMIWKLGLCRDSRPTSTIRSILQMLIRAAKHKGLVVPAARIRFFDTATGKTYKEDGPDASLCEELELAAEEIARTWEQPL